MIKPGWIVNSVCLLIDKRKKKCISPSLFPNGSPPFAVLTATLSQTNFVPVPPGLRNSFVKPCMNRKNWFVFISFQHNSFLQWFSDKTWSTFQKKKRKGLFHSLACSYSIPVLSKPDNENGTRQGCPLWKELFPQKSLCGINAPRRNGRLEHHTQPWRIASKYLNSPEASSWWAKVQITYVQFYSARLIHLMCVTPSWKMTEKTSSVMGDKLKESPI